MARKPRSYAISVQSIIGAIQRECDAFQSIIGARQREYALFSINQYKCVNTFPHGRLTHVLVIVGSPDRSADQCRRGQVTVDPVNDGRIFREPNRLSAAQPGCLFAHSLE